jgi:hypothetical protein
MRLVAAVTFLLGTVAAAMAGETPSIYRFPTPPTGFAPITASDAELAKYGLPPRPNPFVHSALPYATWSRAMAAAHTPVEPQVVHTGRRHIRAIVINAGRARRAGTEQSTNWAGQALINPVGSFGAGSYAEVVGQWVVPAVQQAIGTCGGTDVSAIWVGIDGTGGSSDVAQAGTEADASCSGGVNRPSYYAWFEWYPGDEYEVSNFPIAPGESVLVVVQATSATTANATFVDVQSNQYTVLGFAAPSGTTLVGDSAEWIVERPTIGKSLGKLADYGLIWMSSEIAYMQDELNTGSYDLGGVGGPGRTPVTLNMIDDNGNPLSNAFPQGPSAQYFNVVGSAY